MYRVELWKDKNGHWCSFSGGFKYFANLGGIRGMLV